jgi:O-antigen/teichoic acid export membrane protein
MHYFLISLGHSVAANALLFLRTTVWVFPLVIVGYIYPQTRVINALWFAWLGGLGLYFICLLFFILRWPLKSFSEEGFHYDWIFHNIANGKMIYFNDLCVVGLMFSDRFIINHFLGLKRAGQYVYFLSFGYAIYNLCLTSISQIYTPKMVLFFKNNDIRGWKKTISYATSMSVVFSVFSSVFIFGLLFYLNRKLAMAGGSGLFVLFPIICLFSTLKIVSETFNFGIYAMKRDRLLSYINIFSFVLNSVFMMIGIFVYGEIGLAAGMAGAALITAAIRYYVLKRFEAILTAG